MNVFDYGVESIDITLNQADDRESIEKIKINDDLFLGESRPILVAERKAHIKDLIELYGRFLTFKQTTTIVGGDADLSD